MNHIEVANNVLKDIQNNDRTNAAKKINSLLEANADLSEKWGAITRLSISIGEIKSAVKSAQQYLDLSPNNPKRILQVAGIYAETGQIQKSIDLVESFAHNVDSIGFDHFLGTAYSQIGSLDKAKIHLNKVLNANPLIGISWLTLAAIKNFSKDDDDLTILKSIETKMRSGNDIQNQMPYWFAYGKALLDIGEETEAFSKYAIGNQYMKSKMPFNKLAYEEFIESVISNQTQDYFKKLPELETPSSLAPIFIIGLPRSGTTLLQQILTSHSTIPAGGESNCFTLAVNEVGQAKINALSSKEDAEIITTLKTIRESYSHLIKERFNETNNVVDKTLNLNHHLGLIIKCFPNAKIIKISRNSKDNAWSCFRAFFNQGLLWSNSIEDIAFYFKLENKLYSHWKSIFGNSFFEITYEELVSNPKPSIESLTNFLGLEFEPKMLKFYKNNHAVQTSSVGQVRNDFNTNSVGIPASLSHHFDEL